MVDGAASRVEIVHLNHWLDDAVLDKDLGLLGGTLPMDGAQLGGAR